jgi:uncharacterized protein
LNPGGSLRDYRTMPHRAGFAGSLVAAALVVPLMLPSMRLAAAEPSFACAGNLTPTEAAICKNDDLAALDRALAAAFKSKLDGVPGVKAHSDDDDRDAIVIAQKAWIVHRNECGADKACIRKAYAVRTGALTAGPNTPDTPCRDTVGAKQAALYVQQCLQVATATHPPCNAENTCELIISHNIDRCAFLGDGHVPKFCAALPKPN